MPIGSVVLPVSTCAAKVQSVPESFKLGNSMQLAFINQGDGFFDFRGTMVVGGVSRLIRELNGEVIPGTGRSVKIRDYISLIDGILVGGQNKEKFEPTKFDILPIPSGVSGIKFVCLEARVVQDNDGLNVKDHDRGVFTLQDNSPTLNSGRILVAKLTIPVGMTQVTNGMIDQSVKDFLRDVDTISSGTLTSHGSLGGLTADDHTQYALANKTRPAVWVTSDDLSVRSINDLGDVEVVGATDGQVLTYNAGVWSPATLPTAGFTDHGDLSGLSDDDHSQYLLANGQRALTGALAVDPLIKIDGVDLSEHIHDGIDGSTVLPQSSITNLTADLAAKALDSAVVHNTGAESIAGAKTFADDIVISGDLTVNGETTTIESQTLSVADAAIVVNHNGNDASSEGAGVHVERTGTFGSIAYENGLTSKWKVGAIGSESEVLTAGTAQAVTGVKTFEAAIVMAEDVTVDGIDLSKHKHTGADGAVKVIATDLDPVGGTDGQVLSTSGGAMAWATPASGVTDHGALTGLGDDDHTQYLLASGGRALSGDMLVDSGVKVDGVDISAHTHSGLDGSLVLPESSVSGLVNDLAAKALDSAVVHTTGAESVAGVKTFVNDVVVAGNLTVNGATTSINTSALNVTDKNISINQSGSDASAEGAGITVDRVGMDGSIVYANALASKFKCGNIGEESEIIVAAGAQTVTGVKTFDTTAAVAPTVFRQVFSDGQNVPAVTILGAGGRRAFVIANDSSGSLTSSPLLEFRNGPNSNAVTFSMNTYQANGTIMQFASPGENNCSVDFTFGGVSKLKLSSTDAAIFGYSTVNVKTLDVSVGITNSIAANIPFNAKNLAAIGNIIPNADVTTGIGTSTARIGTAYFGWNMGLHFTSLAAETVAARDWKVGIVSDPNLAGQFQINGSLQFGEGTFTSGSNFPVMLTPGGSVVINGTNNGSGLVLRMNDEGRGGSTGPAILLLDGSGNNHTQRFGMWWAPNTGATIFHGYGTDIQFNQTPIGGSYCRIGTGEATFPQKMILGGASNAGQKAALNIPVLSSDPVTVTNGDIWATDVAGVTKINLRVGGVTKSVTLA